MGELRNDRLGEAGGRRPLRTLLGREVAPSCFSNVATNVRALA